MKKTLFLCAIIILSFSCTNNAKGDLHDKNLNAIHIPTINIPDENSTLISNDNSSEDNSTSDINFPHCDKDLMIWHGGLQSLNAGQIRELYHFGQCISGSESFDFIWVLDTNYEQRSKLDVEDIRKLFKSNDFDKQYLKKEFSTFIFKLPLAEVEDPILDNPYVFPCTVETYYGSSKTGGLIFKGTFDVATWEEYTQLRYNSIFN